MQKIEDKKKPLWLKRDYAEVEELVIKLAKQGLTSEKIGLVLRDIYGVPTVGVFNTKISSILKKANLNQEPQDIKNLKEKAEQLNKHMSKNSQDKVAKRSSHITQDKIKKSLKYYKKKGVLEA